MNKYISADARRSVLLGFIVLGLVAAIVFLPARFRSQAGVQTNRTVEADKTVSHEQGLENYDIRTDKNQAETLVNFRQTAGRDAVAIADARDKFVAGEDNLRRSVPTLKVEYNEDIRTPEVIGPDPTQGRAFLTAPSSAKRADILRNFVEANNRLIGVTIDQAAKLKVAADYTNPDGNISYVHLEQLINNIPVFRGEVKAGFNKNGEMVRVINNLAPGLDYNSLSTDFRNPADAVRVAAGNIGYELKSYETSVNRAESTDLKAVFGSGDWATTAEKMYFPTEPGVARASWRVLIWEPVNAYYVIVDAETGTVLWRKNLTNDQTQTATFSVYANSNSMINVAESPAPMTPGPIDPALGTQGAPIARTTLTFVGNEGALSFNNLGWITDGANGTNGWTDGNAVQAGLDIDSTNGVDAPVSGVSRAFTFAYNPPPGMPAPPDDIASANFRNGAVTQLFYVNNRYHDEMYKLGFTEAARNYQNDNFGRGGIANDRVSAEAQDSSGTNNANFSIAADGVRGRMQMYRFTQTPNRDGDLDADVIVHEHTHGLSQRLIGNAAGLSSNRAGSMGEGWGDFYGMSMLSEPSDPINGVYTTGAYVTYQYSTVGTANSYYGIRRFPYAVKAFTGGPNNRPHNPMTFANVNTGNCASFQGAYAARFTASSCNEVHAAGEIWALTLWEARAKFVSRLGWATGNRRFLQIVTDGMKLSPLNPNFVQERDSILAAAQALSAAPEAGLDVSDVWAGFAIRGLGFGATDNGTTAVESFALPNAVVATTGFSVADTAPGGDGDGVPEPGETVQLTVPVTNVSGNTVNNVSVALTGGATVGYGNINNGDTVTRTFTYQIPANALCGSQATVTLTLTSDLGAQPPVTRSFTLGSPSGGLTQNFDGVTAPALPAGWTSVQTSGTGITWTSSTTTPSSAPNTAFANDPATTNAAALVSPAISINSTGAQLKFKNQYATEATWDGMVLEFSTNGGTTWTDIITGGGSFVSGGYNSTLSSSANPLTGRPAWNGTSAGIVDTVVNLPASMNGQSVQFRWVMGSDASVSSTGVRVDDVVVVSSYVCSSTPTARTKFDFDGDGKADIAVFRPTGGFWYTQGSTSGFTGAQFGASTDKAVPADYDGDGKTDLAVYRSGSWYIQRSTAGFIGIGFGDAADIPQPADFNNDGKADLAVWRPSNGTWYIYNLAGGASLGAAQFGATTDKPMVGDYDNDGKADYAVFRPSNGTWYIQRSTAGFLGIQFGDANDKPVAADFDGDGKTDQAVFRPSNGTWYLNRSTAGFTGTQFGTNGDIPVAADYDGDGKADIAVYRSGTWYVQRSTAGFLGFGFGGGTDVPVESVYIP